MALIDPKNETAAPLPIAQKALKTAQGQLGVSEDPRGSNSGPMVNKYLQSVGLKPGYAWCQSFVYWCYEQAAEHSKKANPVIKTGGVLDCWNKTAAENKITRAEALRSPTELKPGDQFILSFGKGAGHTGLIESIDGNTLHTIEGNSNANGGREGYEVVRHKRNLDDKYLLGLIKY